MKKVLKKTMSTILLSLCIFVILLLGLLFVVSGIFQKPLYLEPWEKSYSEKFDDPRMRLAAHGLLAASGHNMQPWKIELDGSDPQVFYLYADSSRTSPQVDPLSRQFMVSQGTFLENVSVAGQALGYDVALDFFPNGTYDEQNLSQSMDTVPVAKIALQAADPQATSLYDALFLPDTNRGDYLPDKLSQDQIEELEAISKYSGITLRVFQDDENLKKLGDDAVRAGIIEAGNEAVMQETEDIFRSNESRKNQYRYGFSVEGQGTAGVMKHILQGLVTLFPSMNSGKAAVDRFVSSIRSQVDSTPAYVLITTEDNGRESQVKSGLVYSRLILEAHRMGLALQPLSQALEEYPQMEDVYRAIHKAYAPEGGTIQMLVRIGKSRQTYPLSMRRDVTELLKEPDSK